MPRRFLLLCLLPLCLSCDKDDDPASEALFPSNTVAWCQIYGTGLSYSVFGLDDTLHLVAPPSPFWEDECEQELETFELVGDTLRIALTDSTHGDYLYTLDGDLLHLRRQSATDRFRFTLRQDEIHTCEAYAATPGLQGAFTGEGLLTDPVRGEETCSVVVYAEHGFLWVSATSDAFTRLAWGVGAVTQPATYTSLAGEAAYFHEELGSFFYLDQGAVDLQTWSATEIAGSLSGVFYDRVVDNQGAYDEDATVTLSFSVTPSIASALPPFAPWSGLRPGAWTGRTPGR